MAPDYGAGHYSCGHTGDTPCAGREFSAGDVSSPDNISGDLIVLLALSVMIFYFSIIFAVVAVVYAGLAESAYSDNRLQDSAHNARVAKVWCIVTGVTIGLQILVLLALLVLVFVSAVSSM